ncbi:MAG: hypothetical protein AB3N23_09010 [Paracoccaceae bacterium]
MTPRETPAANPVETPAAIDATQTTEPRPTLARVQPSETAPEPVTPAPIAPIQQVQPIPHDPQQPEVANLARVAALPIEQPEAAKPVEDTERPTTPTISPRPASRPKHIEAEAPPKPEPAPTSKPKPKPKQAEKAPPKSQPRTAAGNSDRNAKRGTETGKATSKNTASSSSTAKTAAAGNAAITSYKGKVFRRIARAKPRGVKVRDAALVSLTTGSGGQLQNVCVARSSWYAKLDQLAVPQVRRAAAFTPTPNGQSMPFSVSIKGGG